MRLRNLVGAAAMLAVSAGLFFAIDRSEQPGSGAGDTAGSDLSARFVGYEPAPEPNGKLDKVVWPEYVLDAGGDVKRLYEFQITHGELMRYIPCFCGCGQSAGHRSNRDCYIKRVNGDGSVVFDSMAPT